MKKNAYLTLALSSLLLLMTATHLIAATAKSRLNSDPNVLYFEQLKIKPITLTAKQATFGYATKKGGRKLGTYQAGTQLTLIAMTHNAYKVVGMARNGKVRGWIAPAHVEAKDPAFAVNIKKFYERQMKINELIANHDVAIGMTIDEVQRSLGEPTTKETRISEHGRSGKWEFIQAKEQKHYNYFRDPYNGMIYKRFSHTTVEEKSRLTVEFKDEVVSSIVAKENGQAPKIKIIAPPIYCPF